LQKCSSENTDGIKTNERSDLWEGYNICSDESVSVEVSLRRMSLEGVNSDSVEKQSPRNFDSNADVLYSSPVKTTIAVVHDGDISATNIDVNNTVPKEECSAAIMGTSELPPPSPQFDFRDSRKSHFSHDTHVESQKEDELSLLDNCVYSEELSIPAPPALYSPQSLSGKSSRAFEQKSQPPSDVLEEAKSDNYENFPSVFNPEVPLSQKNSNDIAIGKAEDLFPSMVTPNKHYNEFPIVTSVKSKRNRGYHRRRTESEKIVPLKKNKDINRKRKLSSYCIIM